MIVLRSQTGYESLWASAHITGMSLGEAGAILGGGSSGRETTPWTAQIEFFFIKNAFLGLLHQTKFFEKLLDCMWA